ncbi:MAG: UPF0280 family protein [Burkholderiaceae bacterium]
MRGACVRRLAASRWHFQHGPIDLIINLDGHTQVAAQAIEEVFGEFSSLLTAMVACLPQLRQPASQIEPSEVFSRVSEDPMASRVVELMLAAVAPHTDLFLTPMIAVAGSVGQAVLERLERPGLDRIIVNNGGDIALFLAAGQQWRGAITADLNLAKPMPHLEVSAASSVRGIATSGWRGRSFSLGIADAVTVLADHANTADAAATLIANATNVESPAVARAPARTLDPDSDLGQRKVTIDVNQLSDAEITCAIQAGCEFAEQLLNAHHIRAYRIALANQTASNQTSPDLLMSAGMSECSA